MPQRLAFLCVVGDESQGHVSTVTHVTQNSLSCMWSSFLLFFIADLVNTCIAYLACEQTSAALIECITIHGADALLVTVVGVVDAGYLATKQHVCVRRQACAA